MVFEHRMFRRVPTMIRAVAGGDTKRAALVGDFLDQLVTRLRHHSVLVGVAPDLAHRDRITGLLDRVNVLLPRWWHTADEVTRDLLADVIAEAAAALDEHLVLEDTALPPSHHRERQAFPRSATTFVFVGALLEDASPAERTAFLRRLPAPTRLAWHLIGHVIHRRAVRDLRENLPSAS
jgi:hypothetical protein